MLLECKNITKYYGGFCALEDVNIGVEEGEFVSLIGPNGAGKTTLINVLVGVLRPEAGCVLYKGKDITGATPEGLTKLGIVRSFQLLQIFPDLTILQAIKVAIISREGKGWKAWSSLKGDKDLEKEAIEIAERFNLLEQKDEKAKHLSQGAKKLLDVATAVALRPEIILLDEPTSGVGTKDKHIVMQILLRASQEMGIKTILQVEHDMDLVFSFSSRVIAILQGKVLADGTPEKIRENESVLNKIIGHKESFSRSPSDH